MSVRDGLLAILTLGDAYGLQLHSEFQARAIHRSPVNVGQVYSTLDRAVAAGLVESAGEAARGLPLSRLTTVGRAHAIAWMSQPISGPPQWDEMLDQIVITATIAPARIRPLAEAYSRTWTRSIGAGEDVAASARRALSSAAEDWLAAVQQELSSGSIRPLSTVRPRRGRRPAHVA